MEFLIRVVDKGPGKDQSKRGDVIAACPDGHPWSNAERTNPEWRIVRAPVVPSVGGALLSQAPTSKAIPRSQPIRRRDWRFDCDRLPVGTGIVDMSKAAFMGAVAKK